MKSNTAVVHLQKDPVMARIISQYTLAPLGDASAVDVFGDLISSIISQQLSIKAADAIEKRVRTLMADERLTPQSILDADQESLRGCGLSYAKIKYVRSAADAALSGLVDFENLDRLSDEEVISELVQIAGVGQWTAEMMLMFSLQRPDVFSVGDLGLRNAVSRLYGVDRDDRVAILQLSERWAPYRTMASRYLWASLENTPTVAKT